MIETPLPSQKPGRTNGSISCPIAADTRGRFTIDDIAPGGYRISAKFLKSSAKRNNEIYIARADFEITVPEAAAQEDYDTVVDVGQFNIEMTAPGLQIGKPMPEIQLMDLDGKSIILDKYRGNYLIVNLGLITPNFSMREAGFETLKILYNTYKQTQQLEILSLSLPGEFHFMEEDSIVKACRYYVAQKEIPWIVCVEKTEPSQGLIRDVFEKYTYNNFIPRNILIDPQGMVIAIPKNEEDLIEKVNQLLESQ